MREHSSITLREASPNSDHDVASDDAAVTTATNVSMSYRARTDAVTPNKRMMILRRKACCVYYGMRVA